MVFNPLDHLESDSSEEQLESNSSLYLENPGYCPKCGKAFGAATAAGLPVYYCATCRVTEPLPNN